MSRSHVGSIESLKAFRHHLLEMTGRWDRSLQEIRLVIHRAEEHFTQLEPQRWRTQLALAERELGEARDQLQAKQSSLRRADRPPATEATKRVRMAEQRVRLCQEKRNAARKWAIEINKQCDDLLGPLAEMAQQCEVLLPTAAAQLQQIIDQLKQYASEAAPAASIEPPKPRFPPPGPSSDGS